MDRPDHDPLDVSWQEFQALNEQERDAVGRGLLRRYDEWAQERIEALGTDWVVMGGRAGAPRVLACGSFGEWPDEQEQACLAEENEGRAVYVIDKAMVPLLQGARPACQWEWRGSRNVRVEFSPMVGVLGWGFERICDEGVALPGILDTGSPCSIFDAASARLLNLQTLAVSQPREYTLLGQTREAKRIAARVALRDSAGGTLVKDIYPLSWPELAELLTDTSGPETDFAVLYGLDVLSDTPEVSVLVEGRGRRATVVNTGV